MTQPFEAQLSTCLANAQNQDKATRETAEAFLQQAERENWGAYVCGLSAVLADDGAEVPRRQLAGLMLKNALDAKDSVVQAQKTQKWQALDDAAKAQIRTALLNTLASQVSVAGHGAAMVIAKVARIELLAGQWPDLLECIHRLVAPESPEATREHALECLGFICEEHVDATERFPQEETNKMLTSLVQGMQMQQPGGVRLAATRALCDAIEFASFNFDKEAERNYLMQVICEVMIAGDQRIRLAAYQNINKVLELHYRYLEPYISAIYGLTTAAFKDDSDDVAMQAIEFWTSLAEIEASLQEQEEEEEFSSSGEPDCKKFLERCSTELTPLLLQLLMQQTEDQDESDSEWNKCMAATVALMQISRCVKEKAQPQLEQFIKENIAKNTAPAEWRCREAALTAFGCLVVGPSRAAVLPFVSEAFSFLFDHALKDPHPMVRRTALWTVGNIFKHLHIPDVHPQLITADNVGYIVDALLQAMLSDHAVATKACYAIQQLAEGFSAAADRHELTPFFMRIAEELLKMAYTEVPADAGVALHITAFEAMHTLIANAAKESIEPVTRMTPHFLSLIEQTLAANAADKAVQQRRAELQQQLCAALQVAIKRACDDPKAKEVIITQHADNIMAALLKLQATRSSVNDEVVMTMCVLCQEQGEAFHRYLPHVMPTLMEGLTRHEDLQVCRVCVNTMGDIAREVTSHLEPYADQIMAQLLANLRSENLNRDVKPDILLVFGDMAQGLGLSFDRYVGGVFDTLRAAMNIAYANQVTYTEAAEADPAIVDYNNELRLAICKAAEGILVSLPEDASQLPPSTAQSMPAFGRDLLRFVQLISDDLGYADDSLITSCVNLLGDLTTVPGVAQEMRGEDAKRWMLALIASAPNLDSRAVQYTHQRLLRIGVTA